MGQQDFWDTNTLVLARVGGLEQQVGGSRPGVHVVVEYRLIAAGIGREQKIVVETQQAILPAQVRTHNAGTVR